jgi:PQQ-like domain
LLIADRGNNRMLLVDSSRHIYWRYPGGARKAMPFVFDDDTFFGPGHDRIISNQEDQNTIQIISFPGKRVLWRYGHVNVKSGAAGYLHTPDDAYLLPSRLISVADAYNCRVLFIARDHAIVRQYGTTGVCRHDPPRYLGAVNGATPLRDGGTLISEIAGSWIDDIGPNGRLRWSVRAPVAYPSDPQLLSANRILLADYSKPGAAIIMTRSGRVIWRYGPSGGPGALDHPSLATRIAPGLIAINDDYRDRVVIVSVRTGKIVWQYGHTDQPGTSDGYLNTPDGLDLLATQAAQAQPDLRSLFTRHKAPSPSTPVTPGQKPTVQVSVPFHLPAPVEREVAVSNGGAILIAGGLDAAGNSTDGVFRMTAGSPVLTSLGTVPEAFHDAAGGIIGDRLFVFGGGAAQSSSAVQRFDLATHTAKIVAQLPRPLSDIASASTPDGVYLVGGYDGHVPRREIYHTSDGLHFHEVAQLPVGLRYPAVAALGSTLVIAGGTSIAGASDRIYLFDTKSGVLTSFGHLPAATAHAQAFALGGAVYVGGGVDASGNVTGSVYRVDLNARRVSHAAGSLPVRDGATVALGNSALVLGGATTAGTTAAVRRITVP